MKEEETADVEDEIQTVAVVVEYWQLVADAAAAGQMP